MRELQTCDFCGADPVGVYEPLPASLAADQPRVALCAGCRDTLRRVLAPLDADAESDASSDPAATAESDDATATADDSPTDETVAIDQSPDGEAAAETASANRPPGYGQVLRLVRNRDEPLARDALESLASSAYDVSASEVRRAVDAAVENGDLEEFDGGIRAA